MSRLFAKPRREHLGARPIRDAYVPLGAQYAVLKSGTEAKRDVRWWNRETKEATVVECSARFDLPSLDYATARIDQSIAGVLGRTKEQSEKRMRFEWCVNQHSYRTGMWLTEARMELFTRHFTLTKDGLKLDAVIGPRQAMH